MKVALVHDWLPFMGGAERILTNFLELYKDAPIYTSICNRNNLDGKLKDANIITSFLQKKKDNQYDHKKLFPFMPVAFESFNLNEYDVVLSQSTSCAKGVITNPNTMHICYCNSPMRYGWEFYYEYTCNMKGIKKSLVKYFMSFMRVWDNVSSDRVDYFIANSENVARRIWKHYRRESVVIHPPVRCSVFSIGEVDENFFLVVSRLQEYKRIDLAVKAFNELGLPLVIIGDGPMRKELEDIANDNIKFLGRQSDETIKEYYAKCRAFIFQGEEDFGITPLEAQASGRPVIAYGKGGALETVVDGKTGVFFGEQTVESLKNGVSRFNKMKFNKIQIRTNALRFDEEKFKEKIGNFVDSCYDEFKKQKKWKVL